MERKGALPGVRMWELDGEGDDAVAVSMGISDFYTPPKAMDTCYVRRRQKGTHSPSYLNPALGAHLLLNFQLLSTRTILSVSLVIVLASLKRLGSVCEA